MLKRTLNALKPVLIDAQRQIGTLSSDRNAKTTFPFFKGGHASPSRK